jgi:hypothetical protein
MSLNKEKIRLLTKIVQGHVLEHKENLVFD